MVANYSTTEELTYLSLLVDGNITVLSFMVAAWLKTKVLVGKDNGLVRVPIKLLTSGCITGKLTKVWVDSIPYCSVTLTETIPDANKLTFNGTRKDMKIS
ncbi:hypothetical protein KSF78_0006188 [Schistosoma japonicum]|nr:hypothetical protein KSF78_0006188 [Schistosoma japonicum]